MLLANISTKFVVGDSIPKVSFRTLCDLYIDLCFGLQVVEIFFILLSFIYREQRDVADLINTIAFTIQVYTFVVFHFWLAWRLHEHCLDVIEWQEGLILENRESCRRPQIGSSFLSLRKSKRFEEVTNI